MDAAMACMKYILFTLNFILWCMGGALMALGVYVRSDSNFWEFTDKLPIGQYYQACYVAIVVGVILLIVGFLGCCGAATESTCMLIFYFVLMFIMVILEFVAAGLVWKISSTDKLEEHLRDHIKEHVDNVQTNWQSMRFMDILQLHLHCCGSTNMEDYLQFGNWRPQSCHDQRTNNLFYHGCAEMLRTWLEKKSAMIGGIALALVLFQITSLVFSVCLICAFKQEDKGY